MHHLIQTLLQIGRNQLYLEELQHFHPLVGKRRSFQYNCGF